MKPGRSSEGSVASPVAEIELAHSYKSVEVGPRISGPLDEVRAVIGACGICPVSAAGLTHGRSAIAQLVDAERRLAVGAVSRPAMALVEPPCSVIAKKNPQLMGAAGDLE
jgi:hypothetical protein